MIPSYLDSCVVIYGIEGDSAMVRRFREVFRDPAQPRALCVSELTRLVVRFLSNYRTEGVDVY